MVVDEVIFDCNRGLKVAPVRPVNTHKIERKQSRIVRHRSSCISRGICRPMGVTMIPRLPRTMVAMARERGRWEFDVIKYKCFRFSFVKSLTIPVKLVTVSVAGLKYILFLGMPMRSTMLMLNLVSSGESEIQRFNFWWFCQNCVANWRRLGSPPRTKITWGSGTRIFVRAIRKERVRIPVAMRERLSNKMSLMILSFLFFLNLEINTEV